jgi:isochorismate synthase
VREDFARVLAEAAVQGSGPLAFAGFAFDPLQADAERWQCFPDGLAVLPRLLFTRRGAVTSLTLNSFAGAGDDPAALARGLERELDAALAPAPRVSPATAAAIAAGDARRAWLDNVADLTRRIAAGEADKVVLARRLELIADAPFGIDTVAGRLRRRFPAATIFAARIGEDVFMGATPETLVRLEGATVETDCLAGSYPRGRTAEEDDVLGHTLLADEKERREHAIVVKALSDCLRPLCRDIDVPATPLLRRTATVQHLHTPVRGMTERRRHILELVARLHPTPATSGWPLQRSLCLIRGHESFARGWYAGPIGWFTADGDGEFAVALRSALLQGRRASLYAGCGIVSGSDPEREYEESAIKLETMLWALNAQPQDDHDCAGLSSQAPGEPDRSEEMTA